MSISRARSWPLLDTAGRGSCASVDDSSLKEKKNRQAEESSDGKNNAAAQPDGSTQVQARRLLCRHYYPEGGWGWVVTVVSTLVHLLGSGLQLSIPATVALPAKVKFYHHPLYTAGESRYSRTIFRGPFRAVGLLSRTSAAKWVVHTSAAKNNARLIHA